MSEPEGFNRGHAPIESPATRAARISANAARWIAVFSLVSFLTSAATFFILRGQLNAISKQYDQLKRSADAAESAAETASDTLTQNRDSFTKTLGEMQKQSRAMQDAATATTRQARASTDALLLVQRAFLFIRFPSTTLIGTPSKVERLDVHFEWENAGATPTINMETHVNHLWYPTSLPNNFTYPDLWDDGAPHINTPAVVGPKATAGTQDARIPIAVIEQFLGHQQHIYFWGWTRYKDVFERTPTHLTEFCYELTNVEGNVTSTNPNESVRVTFSNCPTHNCYEKGCADYDARIKAN